MRLTSEELSFWRDLLSMLEAQYGSNCEIVLHDLTKDYNHTIVDIRNGHITGRKIGDCGNNLGLEVLSGNAKNGNRYNYVTRTDTGKILRSSTQFLRDDDGKIIGSLCINMDITESLAFEKFLHNYNGTGDPAVEVREFFTTDVKSLLECLIQEAQLPIDKTPEHMDRADKLKFLEYLDSKGAFLITKSSERVCEYLGISRYTLYNYLDLLRSKQEQD